MLSTGEMIDSLRSGEIAESACGSQRVKYSDPLRMVYVNEDGSIDHGKGVNGYFHVFNDYIKKMKWRILPQYVTFEEAKKAYEEGKTIKCEYPGKFDGVIYCETFNKREPEDVEALSMYMITEGKWSVEDDS